MAKRTNLTTLRVISVFLVALGAAATAAEATIYVDADAIGANNGSSWTNAYNYLQNALADASSGDEIRVAEGIYKPDEDSAHPNGTGSRTATFRLKNGMAIKGGYAGFGEPDPNAQDIKLCETILSGDLLGNDGPGFANNGENSYHVVTASGTDATAILDGFTITAGNANYPNILNPKSKGGGIFNDTGSPTITNCTFSGNSSGYAGGGMYSYNYSCPKLTNCTFTGNSANYGGGMYNRESSPTLTNCTFSANSAIFGGGGGMYNEYSSPTVTNCTFSTNSAKYGGGGMDNCHNSSPRITNCTFSANSADGGGGMYNWDNSSPTLTNCTFSKNSAIYSGGGMYNYEYSSPTLTNCTFSENSAIYSGGGGMLNYEYSSATLTNCTFSKNSARWHGGGMYNYDFSSPTITNCTFSANSARYGGGVYNRENSPILTNCTLSANSAIYSGGGMYNWYNSSPTLTNCILWADLPSEIYGGTPIVTYSDVQGGWLGEGNIDAEPCFVDPGYWGNRDDPNIVVEPNDPNAVWVDGDYHLLPSSPCINAGDPNYAAEPNETDLDGKPRVIGGRIDMGAYEFNHIPVADVGPNQIVEAQGAWGARVTLDGSCSSDADSTPETNDDIVSFDWYKVDACDPNFEDFLGSGEIIDCNLPLGEHIIVLEVIDRAGAFDTNEVTIVVQDTTPPDFTLSVTPTTLWPVNHKMVLITPSWTASDICDESPEVSLVSITMNEDDEAKGDGNTTNDIQVDDNGLIYLRAERSGAGSGRIYTITYQAVDDSGNAAVARATVTVPHDQR